MRKEFLFWLGIVASVAGYFLLLDFFRPALEKRHLIPIWWATLGLYVILVGGSGFWHVRKDRPCFAATGFLLICATLYLYDPTINSHLESIGLRWVWIVPLIAYFLWILAWVKRRPRTPEGKAPECP